MDDVLTRVARAETPAPLDGLEAWRARHLQRTAGVSSTVARAAIAGAAMDRVGYAFASGYWSALQRLVPTLQGSAVLAATEAGGAHPRAIETRLTRGDDGRWRLRGHKTWCTLGPHAERLWVVARTGEDAEGRPTLRVVDVPAGAPGVRVEVLPDLPFVPEIPHAALTLDDVVVDDDALLPGDGYADLLKPFRTIEDVHVFAALAGHVAPQVRQRPELVGRALALIAALITVGALDPRAPATHLALGAALAEGRALFDEVGAALDGITAERWARDRPLLQVAHKARRARLEAAERALCGER